MKASKRVRIMIFILILVTGTAIVCWSNDYLSKRQRVEDALLTSIQQAAEIVQHKVKERDKVLAPKSMPYYAVDMHDPGNQLVMLQEVLYELNSLENLPPLKLKAFRISQLSSIDVNATVEYVTLFGIHKNTSIHVNVQRIPYIHQTGEETYR